MKIHREPKVFMIAATEVYQSAVFSWLESLGASQETATIFAKRCNSNEYDSPGETLIELGGRRCYKSFEPGLNANVTKVREDPLEYMRNVLKSGHGSILEHTSVTFAIENVSRVFTHEIVRNRAGMAFSQESQRYVRLDDFDMVIPISDHDNKSSSDFTKISDKLVEKIVNFIQNELALSGEMLHLKEMTSFSDKKKLTSSIRRLIPNGVSTGIIITGNLRAWRHVLEQRGNAIHAEIECVNVMNQIGHMLLGKYPNIFDDFRQTDNGWECQYHKV